jgi:UDP-3-O-[3-hydroxymyristoyl] glucosamine N-acyltransferase
MKFTLQQIADLLGGKVIGNPAFTISRLGKIDEPNESESICFLANPKYENYIYSTNATAVIVSEGFQAKNEIKASLVVVKDAYTGFTRLLEEYEKIISAQYHSRKLGIEEPSFIHKSLIINEGLFVGAFAYISAGCTIGQNVKIYPHTYIGENVMIGDNTVIYAGVKIYPNTKIGKNCAIHAGAVIGSEGFGFAPQADGSFKNIPQLGNVVLEDEVSIGANTTIDRSTLGSTIIRKGAKLDNLIQIGHNVEIGKNTVMAAQVGIAGSTKIGDNCMLGGQAGLAGHISIADYTKIGAQSGLNASIKEPNTTVLGAPAFEYKGFMKSSVIFRKLPDLQKRIEQLEQKILTLPSSQS